MVSGIGEAMSKKRPSGKSAPSSDAGVNFAKEQREASDAGEALVRELALARAALTDAQGEKGRLERTVEEDTVVIAALDRELKETKRESAEKAKFYRRLEGDTLAASQKAGNLKKQVEFLESEAERKLVASQGVVTDLHAKLKAATTAAPSSEQGELIERLRAEAKESRAGSGKFEELLAAERKRYAEMDAEKDVDGADPAVLVLLQNLIRGNPNCDTSDGGIMHRQCRRGRPCLFRRARQMLRGHGMEIG